MTKVIITLKSLIFVTLAMGPAGNAHAQQSEGVRNPKLSLRIPSRLFNGRRLIKSPPAADGRRPRRVRRRGRGPAQRLGPQLTAGWGYGEAMTYAIKLLGVEGGRAAISVGKPGKKNGRRGIILSGLGETAPFISAMAHLRERVRTLVALDGLTPIHSTSSRTTPGKERDMEVSFGPRVRQVIKKKGKTRTRTRRIAPAPFDPISALFSLRAHSLKKGQELTMRVLSGTSLYEVTLKVTGTERLYLKRLKPRDALRLDGVARRITDQGHLIKRKPPRSLSIWFSADDLRVPLKLIGDTKLGPLEAQLSSYQAPPAGTRVRLMDRSVGKKISAFGTRR